MLIKTHIDTFILLSNNFTHFVKFLKRNIFNMFEGCTDGNLFVSLHHKKITEPNEYCISYRRQKRNSYFT